MQSVNVTTGVLIMPIVTSEGVGAYLKVPIIL